MARILLIISALVIMVLPCDSHAGRYITAHEFSENYVTDWQKYQRFHRIVWDYYRRTRIGLWDSIKFYLLYEELTVAGCKDLQCTENARNDVIEVLGQITKAVLSAGFDSPSSSKPSSIWGVVELPGIGNMCVSGLDEWYLFLVGLDYPVCPVPMKPENQKEPDKAIIFWW